MTTEDDQIPVLLESGDLGWEVGLSGTRIRQLVADGILHPTYITPRGLRLFAKTAVAIVRQWQDGSNQRLETRKRSRAEARNRKRGGTEQP